MEKLDLQILKFQYIIYSLIFILEVINIVVTVLDVIHLFASYWLEYWTCLKLVNLILTLAQILMYGRLLCWQGITLSVVNSGD